MKGKIIKIDNRGQVLGLPMYLIIVMIVAVAVIAAVIFMLPQGTKTIKAQVTDNSVYSLGANNANGVYTFLDFTVTLNVFTADERGDPIVGARVRLSGGGIVGEGQTNQNGVAIVDISGAKLDPNINEAYMTMTIKSSGFEDFTDDSAVLLFRPT